MTSRPVHGMVQKMESRQRGNSPIPVNGNDEQPSISDTEEIPAIEDLSSAEDLEKTGQFSSSPDGSISASLDIPPPYRESTKPSKPIGRLRRWKYCLLGQSKVNPNEKNTDVDCPTNTVDNERQNFAPYLVRKLFDNYVDTDMDLSDPEESNPKVNSQSCSLVCSLGKDECSKSGARALSPDFNVTVDQSNKDLKDKLDSLKDGLNNQDYMDYDCRICHGGTSSGQLVSPCYCTGTMGQMHVACLEQWLGSNGRKDCELCGYRYHLYREPRSFREFLKNPGAPNLARHLKCDLFCFAVLTPTTLISVSLLLFAANLLKWQITWSVVGLISTAIFLVIIYLFWSIMAFTYQRKIWQKWKLTNQVVRLKCTSKCTWDYQESHSPTLASEPSLGVAQLHLQPSTMTVTSIEADSDFDVRLPVIQFNDPELVYSLDPYRLSQSFSDIRAALPSSSSSSCTFSSEPSLVMDTDLIESSSHKRLPKNILKCESKTNKGLD